jgi:alkylhydroperoxidase/carboxymuconolactone decarboxylase family protein YurZ
MSVSSAFQVFAKEAPGFQAAWMEGVQKLGQASSLDAKTQHLCYLSVLAAARLESGLPFHVKLAKSAGATRAEVIGAILVGLPAVGNAVIQSLPAALAAFDA